MSMFGTKTIAAVTAAVALHLDVAAFEGSTNRSETGVKPSPGAEARKETFGAREAAKLYETLAPTLRCREDLFPNNPKILLVHFGINHGSPEAYAKAEVIEREALAGQSATEPESDIRTVARGVLYLKRHFKTNAEVPFIAFEGATNGAPALRSINFVGSRLHALQSKPDQQSQREAAEIEGKLRKEENWLSAAAALSSGRSGIPVRGIEAKDISTSINLEAAEQESFARRTLEIKRESERLTAALRKDLGGTNLQLQAEIETFRTRAVTLKREIDTAHRKGMAANDLREDENVPVIVAQALAAQKGSALIVVPLIFGAEHNFKNNLQRWNAAHPECPVAYLQFMEERRTGDELLDMLK